MKECSWRNWTPDWPPPGDGGGVVALGESSNAAALPGRQSGRVRMGRAGEGAGGLWGLGLDG
jgi:hypothetical protein